MLLDWRLVVLTIVAFLSMFMAVFWLITLLEHRKKLTKDPKPKHWPELSIIIPAYNEEKGLAKCLDSLLNLDYPKKIHLLVIDDGSKDNTRAIAEQYAKKGLIEFFHKNNGGKATAMNMALKHVKTDYVLCMDADSLVDKKALYYMMGYFDDPEVGAVTSALKVMPPRNRLQQIQWIEYVVNILHRKIFALLDILYVTPGPFSVYRMRAINDVGGFDEDNLTEDMEMALHLQKNGWKIENSMNADVFTDTPMTLYSLFNQRVRWYRGLVQNLRKYKHIIGSKEHGLLWRFLMPITIVLVIASIISAALFVFSIMESVYDFAWQMWFAVTIGFNFVFSLDFGWMLFSTNLFVVAIMGFVLITTLVILYLSHKYSREPASWSHRIAYVLFLFVYFLLLAAVWAFSIFKELTGAERTW